MPHFAYAPAGAFTGSPAAFSTVEVPSDTIGELLFLPGLTNLWIADYAADGFTWPDIKGGKTLGHTQPSYKPIKATDGGKSVVAWKGAGAYNSDLRLPDEFTLAMTWKPKAGTTAGLVGTGSSSSFRWTQSSSASQMQMGNGASSVNVSAGWAAGVWQTSMLSWNTDDDLATFRKDGVELGRVAMSDAVVNGSYTVFGGRDLSITLGQPDTAFVRSIALFNVDLRRPAYAGYLAALDKRFLALKP